MSEVKSKSFIVLVFMIAVLSLPVTILAHGDVQPQQVDIEGLEPLGDEWRETNPYSPDDPIAVQIGKIAYNTNCARCHGIDAMSGGFSPDLRELPKGDRGDQWYIEPTRAGVIRNGKEYMPAYEGLMQQEAMWAIRTWLLTLPAPE
jgi:cytochrome c-550 PedF